MVRWDFKLVWDTDALTKLAMSEEYTNFVCQRTVELVTDAIWRQIRKNIRTTFKRRTGTLYRSIKKDFRGTGPDSEGRVWTNLPYALYQERGFRHKCRRCGGYKIVRHPFFFKGAHEVQARWKRYVNKAIREGIARYPELFSGWGIQMGGKWMVSKIRGVGFPTEPSLGLSDLEGAEPMGDIEW